MATTLQRSSSGTRSRAVVYRRRHQLGRSGHRRRARRMCGDADEAGTRAERCDTGETRRARHPRRATDHQHVTVPSLVRGACPRRQCLTHDVRPDESRFGGHVRIRLRRNAEIVEAPQPGVVRTRAQVAAELAPDETHRGIGAYRDAMWMTRCRRRVPRADRPRAAVGRSHSRPRSRGRMRRLRAARYLCRRSHRRSRRRRSRPRRTPACARRQRGTPRRRAARRP